MRHVEDLRAGRFVIMVLVRRRREIQKANGVKYTPQDLSKE
jgi:hypothetical protein